MNDNKKETIGNDLENFIKEKKNGEVLYLDDVKSLSAKSDKS